MPSPPRFSYRILPSRSASGWARPQSCRSGCTAEDPAFSHPPGSGSGHRWWPPAAVPSPGPAGEPPDSPAAAAGCRDPAAPGRNAPAQKSGPGSGHILLPPGSPPPSDAGGWRLQDTRTGRSGPHGVLPDAPDQSGVFRRSRPQRPGIPDGTDSHSPAGSHTAAPDGRGHCPGREPCRSSVSGPHTPRTR